MFFVFSAILFGAAHAANAPDINWSLSFDDKEVFYAFFKKMDTDRDYRQLAAARVTTIWCDGANWSGKEKVDRIPPQIGFLINLEWLELAENRISQLPSQIEFLRKLKVLNLNHNLLTEIPPEVEYLSSLESFSVASNQIKRVTEKISHLIKLEYFFLNSNLLTSLPAGMGGLSSLKELDVSNNQLTTLPKTLPKTRAKLNNLTSINCMQNPNLKIPKELQFLIDEEIIYLEN